VARQAMGRGLPRVARRAGLRPSQIPVTQPDDAVERDADSLADLSAPRPVGAGLTRRSPVSRVPDVVSDALSVPGRPLAAYERPSTLGVDLSAVRVHAGDRAVASARALAAAAYTIGEDIVLGERYDGSSAHGRRLIAHELAHIALQHRRAAPVALSRQGEQRTSGGEQSASPLVRSGAPVVVGAALERLSDEAGWLRTLYKEGEARIAAQLEVLKAARLTKYEIAEFAHTMRDLLKEEVREKGPRLFKRIAEYRNLMKYGTKGSKPFEDMLKTKTLDEIIESATRKTSKVFDHVPAALGALSKVATVLPIGVTVWRVSTASPEDRRRVQGEEIGGHGGSLLGIGACAAFGVTTEGLGFAVCDLIGFTVGSEIGGEIASGPTPTPRKVFAPARQQDIAAAISETIQRVQPLAAAYDIGPGNDGTYTGAANPGIPLQSTLAELKDALRFAQKNDTHNLVSSLKAGEEDLRADLQRVNFDDRPTLEKELARLDELRKDVQTLLEFTEVK
jgi:hypothetical protein